MEAEKLLKMAEEIEEIREDIKRSMKESDCPDWARPLHEAGDWLAWKMAQHGATKEEQDRVTYAMGQRVRMRGVGKSYKIAIECFERWLEGNPDEPGLQLANDLIDGKVDP